MRILRTIFALLSVLVLCGCSSDWKLEIDSNANWHGVYGGVSGTQWSTSEVSGSGSRTIDISDDDRVCVVFQQTSSGYLKIKLKDEGGGLFGIFAASDRDGQTNVNGGTVDICSEGSVPTSY